MTAALPGRPDGRGATGQPNDPQRESISLDRAVELTQRHLRLDAALIAEEAEAGEFHAAVSESTGGFALVVGDEVKDTGLCRCVLGDGSPRLLCDASGDPHVEQLATRLGAPIGAFIAVPLHLPDGTLFGVLCGLSHQPRPDLDERDQRFVSMLADVLARELDERRTQRQILTGISRLIETEDLQVAFQPIVDLGSERCMGVEALARFPAPFQRPDHTLAAADTFGLRLELERLVIREAWKIIPALDRRQFLALNVSPDALVELARRANLRDDLPLAQLVVEVTEHSVVDSYEPLRDQLAPLRARGLRIAVDDAGAGYASLRHVLELRPDFIKIDRSLIHGVADDRAQRVAVRAFQSLALDLGATVVAEGVERAEDLEVVLQLGVGVAQGYLLARPTTDRSLLSPWIGSPAPVRRPNVPEGSANAGGSRGRNGGPSPVLAPSPAAGVDRPLPYADVAPSGDGALSQPPEIVSSWRRDHAGSGLTSRLILTYVEREAGGHAVKRVLEHAGLEEAEESLRDENSWFSYETKLALWSAAEEVLGDPLVALHVGESVLDLSVAMGLKRALRALGTPGFVYGNVARANGKFNWAHELVVIERGSGFVRMRYSDLAGVGYHRHDCDYTRGLLAAVPELFGLPQARVEHRRCGADGASCCEFDVHWTAGLERLGHLAAGVAVAAAALAGVGTVVPALIPVAGAIFVAGEAGIAARALRFMRRRLRVLEVRVREQDDAAERLLSSLQDLSSDLRLDEVLEQITAKARSAVGGKEFALLLDDGVRVSANRHSGIPGTVLEALESWVSVHRAQLGESGAVVVDDLASDPMLSELPAGQQDPFGSMCAAPLVFGDELLGVLVALAHGSTVFLPGDAAALSAYAGHAAMALSNARLVERLERRAAEDPLTGLTNQRAFRETCALEFSRSGRDRTSVAVVMIDLDQFKAINDQHGHPCGDQVLIAVAEALRRVTRAHDTVARLGGEEFALLLPGADAHTAHELAERARQAVAAINVVSTPLSCSAGIAAATPPHTTPGDLLEQADRALYEAKRLGRDRTVGRSPAEPASALA